MKSSYPDIADAKLRFDQDGFITYTNAFSKDTIAAAHRLAMNNFEELMNLIETNNIPLGVGVKNGFKEVVQRHPLRYEMPYKMDDPAFDFVLKDPPIMELLSSILEVENPCVINRSLVISMPGSQDQAWHSDGPHLSVNKYLKCHCLNVFVPLVDVTELNGPTEIRPESQVYTRDLTKQFFLAKLKGKLRNIEKPVLSSGDILMVGCDFSIRTKF
jgi:ectoine hydroxylase-related dioxygenase (phytanoyl-CoA dioxygenase family)